VDQAGTEETRPDSKVLDRAADLETRIRELEGRVSRDAVELDRMRALLRDVEALLARTSARPLPGIDRGSRRRRTPFDPGAVKALYSRRFDERELAKKRAIWAGLAPFFAKRFPEPARSILEIGAGEGEFLDNAKAERRVAIDLNPAVARLAARGIEAIEGDATRLFEYFDDESFDVVFCSNVLEHLYDKDQIHLVIREVAHVLRPGGRFLILQPNFRYVGAAYYDFIDHRLELTAESVVEALEVGDLTVIECHPRFLPYTSKSRLSSFYWLVPLYVRLPLVWRIFGKQAFVVAEKRARRS
jgi:SAM-dependent methyltransferase